MENVPAKILTLCIIEKGDRLLLGRKKRSFGEGRVNGFGGKVEPGETVEQAIAREVLEESGVILGKFEKRGIINFHINYEGNARIEVHVFHSNDFAGEPRDSDEMEILWIPKNAIPYDEMWPDDRFWVPIFLEGKYFLGTGVFDDDHKMISFVLDRIETSNFFSTP